MSYQKNKIKKQGHVKIEPQSLLSLDLIGIKVLCQIVYSQFLYLSHCKQISICKPSPVHGPHFE